MELALCLLTGDWNFVGQQYGTWYMPVNWRLEFCGSAVWNLDHVSQLATGILWVSSMEFGSCLPIGDWNFFGSAVWNLLHVCQLVTGFLWVSTMELGSCLPIGDWNFVGQKYGTCFMSVNRRLEFCGSAVWNLDHVSQLATGILWASSMELRSCLPIGDWNFVGQQYGTCFMSVNWRLEFCGSAMWNLDHVPRLATGILWVSSMELASCLSTGDWNFVGPQYGTWIVSPNWRLEFYDTPPMAQHPPVGQVLLIVVASRSHSGTPHSVGLLCTSDQPDTKTST